MLSSIENTRRDDAIVPNPGSLLLDVKQPIPSTELARREAGDIHSTEVVRRDAGSGPLLRSLEDHEIGPPNSFGSAASQNAQSFYQRSQPGSMKSCGGTEPLPGAVGSTSDVSLLEVREQLRAQQASMEELQRAVRDVQMSVTRLETRVDDVDYQWQHSQQVGFGPEYYQAYSSR